MKKTGHGSKSSDRLFRQSVFPLQSIHLREKQKQVLPCEIKKALAF
jgi:hypothetical protein